MTMMKKQTLSFLLALLLALLAVVTLASAVNVRTAAQDLLQGKARDQQVLVARCLAQCASAADPNLSSAERSALCIQQCNRHHSFWEEGDNKPQGFFPKNIL